SRDAKLAAYQAHADRMKRLHEMTQGLTGPDQPAKADVARGYREEAERDLQALKNEPLVGQPAQPAGSPAAQKQSARKGVDARTGVPGQVAPGQPAQAAPGVMPGASAGGGGTTGPMGMMAGMMGGMGGRRGMMGGMTGPMEGMMGVGGGYGGAGP